MIRMLFIFISAFWVLCVGAQRPALGKMSPYVRQAYYATLPHEGHSVALSKRAPGKSLGSMTAFVKLTDKAERVLEQHRCRVLARYGDLCIADIPLDQLAALSLDDRVKRIETGPRATAQMDTTGIIVKANQVYEGLNPPCGYTGKGVVVGVQDIGFDLTHPNFYTADMSQYRIKAMWDQLSEDTLNSRLPVGRDYVGEEALLRIGRPRDGMLQTHGTHTTGIAAGSGAEGDGNVSPYRGIAYNSDICLVCNATSNDADLIAPEDQYKYTYALDALGFKYIFDYADSVGKPCVINFSEGSTQDLYGYDKLYYEMLDSLVGPGHIIVASAGNDGGRITYLKKTPAQEKVGTFVGSTDPVKYPVVVTTKTTEDFTMQIKLYADVNYPFLKEIQMSEVMDSPDSTYIDSVTLGSYTFRFEAIAYRSSFNSDDIVCDWIIPVVDTKGSRGLQASVCITRSDVDVEMFRSGGYFFPNNLDSSLNDGDNTHSILSPGSAPCVISVGATGYRTSFVNYLGETIVNANGINGVRTPFSAVGPTWDGRTKPDVMAPGQNINSSYSSFYIENYSDDGQALQSDIQHFDYNGRTYAWSSSGGTSMAAPVVTGVIALWLEADPTLTMQDCLDIFDKTCHRRDTTLSYPNNLYGYGEIDAYEGLKLVLERKAAGVKDIKFSPTNDNRIYSVNGQYMGTDATKLPRGLYIRQGRKFVVRN
ncbi:MAG: S8 family serine peptidase [Prevotella sp.]